MNKNELKEKINKSLLKIPEEDIYRYSKELKKINRTRQIVSLFCVIFLLILGGVSCTIDIFLGIFVFIDVVFLIAFCIYQGRKDANKSDKENAIEFIYYAYKNKPNLLEKNIYESISYTNIKTITVSATLTKDNKIHFDEQEQKIIFEMINMPKAEYSYSSILRYEVVENGTSVVKGTAGKALVGGLLFGLEGAIVGSSGSKKLQDKCKELKVIIYLNDFQTPSIIVPFINYETDKDSIVYTSSIKQVRELCALLEYAINNKTLEESSKKEVKTNKTEKSIKEQLQELKEMLEEGLITQKDFNEKKKKLLDL